jgi:hypothetical protein
MHIYLRAGMGDEIALTAFVREVSRQYPNEPICVDGGKFPDVWKGNPRVGGQGKHTLPTICLKPWSNYDDHGPLPVNYAHQAGMNISDPTPEVFVGEAEILKAESLMASVLVGRKRSGPIIAIDTWATWSSRQWEFKRWVTLCEMLQANGWTVVELGREVVDERGDVQPFRLPADVQLYGKTSILEAAAVLKCCTLFVGNDSGLFHLAAAVGTPQVVIFGPKKWFMRAYWTTVPVFATASCSPSCGFTCVLPRHCLKDVHPSDVLRAVDVARNRFKTPRGKAMRIERSSFYNVFGPKIEGVGGNFMRGENLSVLLTLAESIPHPKKRVLEMCCNLGATAVALASISSAPEVYAFDACLELGVFPLESSNEVISRQDVGSVIARAQPSIRERITFEAAGAPDLKLLYRKFAPYDLVHIDGNHSFRGVAEDTKLAVECVIECGLLVWDDYWDCCPGVVSYINDLNGRIGGRIIHVEGTRVCFMELLQGDKLILEKAVYDLCVIP